MGSETPNSRAKAISKLKGNSAACPLVVSEETPPADAPPADVEMEAQVVSSSETVEAPPPESAIENDFLGDSAPAEPSAYPALDPVSPPLPAYPKLPPARCVPVAEPASADYHRAKQLAGALVKKAIVQGSLQVERLAKKAGPSPAPPKSTVARELAVPKPVSRPFPFLWG